jgi:4-amino-4-deoxy-L-arabinose transferase-like glycosyltransferase
MLIVWCILLSYAIGFVCFYPRALTNFDEVSYIRQAVTFAHSSTTVDTIDPFTGTHQNLHPSDYPPGTSALMTPFVWIAGWRGAFIFELLALIGCVFFTARWIAESGGSPLFALIILGYPPTLVMARTGMSDVPSASMVAAGLWLFWPSQGQTAWRRFAAGIIAGATLSLREPNLILFAFFFAGALIRRERYLPALMMGGIAGIATRLISAAIVYGSPLFVKNHGYSFTGLYASQNLSMYLVALLVFVPAGLLCAFLYRGRRWPELVATTFSFTLLFVLYDYNASPSSGLKQWVLAPRFFIPMLPILAFAMAHTLPIWWTRLLARFRMQHRPTWQAFGRGAVVVWLAGIAIVGFITNRYHAGWGNNHDQIVQAVYSNTDPSHPVLTDIPATVKFLNELHGRRIEGDLMGMSETDIHRLLARYGAVNVMFFDRDDSDYWVQKAQNNRVVIENLTKQYPATVALQQRFPGLGVLQIWKIGSRS